ncbi:winged helix-turn-helix transcriptional regulator [Klebsiella pasteurii]|uniref:winged helix-turn-helix transcriptional regulator n=2 Tax=Klebsiella TaxID=570 RepID=UPI0015E902AE|nr:helix-turn-helix domain-containing protein [Klebsiella pasteurii]MBG2718988.1 helix-turn-helix transcriptional regulator [Klebsiella michiganensis]MDS7910997.1 winged helix-turn-helix transcriptional regulator [Klebsiella pasteurii]QMR54171.1 helix-turn-helix transcriptional regulator [Klebsiella michiganensis]
MHGVIQRMLTHTLRQLERDGLVIRHDFREVPSRVEYELSHTGMELLVRMIPLWTWTVENAERFRDGRFKYYKQQKNKEE